MVRPHDDAPLTEVSLPLLGQLFASAPAPMSLVRGPDHVFALANAAYLALTGRSTLVGRRVAEAVPEASEQGFVAMLDEVRASGITRSGKAVPVVLHHEDGQGHRLVVDFVMKPVLDGDGEVDGILMQVVDVTDSVHAAASLRETEERLRLAVDSAEVGFWDVDLVHDVLTWPARTKAMFGISPDAPVTLQDFYDGLHPDDRERTSAAFAAACDPARRALYDVEYRTVGKEDGIVRWVAAKGRALFDRDRCLRVLGTAIDVSARKAAAQALAESQARLRATFDAVPVGIVVADAHGAIIEGNGRAEQIFGHAILRSPDAASYGEWVSYHADGRQVLSAEYPLARVYAGEERPELECEYRRGDGRRAWVRIVGSPIRVDGELVGGLVAVLDIDQERRAQEALARANAELSEEAQRSRADAQRVVQTSRDYIVVSNRQSQCFTQVNPAFAAALGRPSDEILRTPYTDLVHPDDVAATIKAVTAIDEAKPMQQFVNRYRGAAGDWRTIEWNAVQEDGVTYGVGRDITDERAQAAALADAEEALRQAQKMEAIGQLTGGVAHDFNNLLTVIRASADLLKRFGLSDPRKQRYVEAISDTADRAAKLTHQLLAFSRRQALRPEAFDVAEQVSSIVEMLQTVVGERVTLELEAEPALVVEADIGQFETALVNLCVNARDAMDGVGALRIAVADRNGMVRIAVGDTGSGIAPADLQRIFEPFFTTKAVGKGTGLGLSQVYGFAKQSGGDVEVASRPGEGTIFSILLPCSSRMPEATRTGAAAAASGDGARILIVEDNPDVLEMASTLLRDLGHDTVHATSGEAALEVLDADVAFDLVFTDVVMPGFDGIELARRVAARWPAIRVVLTSGFSEGLAAGSDDALLLLPKPYSVAQLEEIIARALPKA